MVYYVARHRDYPGQLFYYAKPFGDAFNEYLSEARYRQGVAAYEEKQKHDQQQQENNSRSLRERKQVRVVK